MRLIHTADLHLGSPLSTHLPREKARVRRAELQATLSRLCDEARRVLADGIIIAGDIFDSDKPTRTYVESFLSTVRRYSDISFFCLLGNHDGGVSFGNGKPENLHLFGESFTEYRIGDVSIIGKNKTSKNVFDTLCLDRKRKNIVVLHGALGGSGDDGILLSGARHLGIDYLALGHYHKYSSTVIDERGISVYSGTPEGRGFDEAHECGYVLIDTDGKISHKFVSFAKRQIMSITVDISEALSSYDVELALRRVLDKITSESIVKVTLSGRRQRDAIYDTHYLYTLLSDSFFHLEIKDEASYAITERDLSYDKSLRGEFIRQALSAGLDEDTLRRVIDMGLRALSGEDKE